MNTWNIWYIHLKLLNLKLNTLDQLFHQQIWNLQVIFDRMSNFNFILLLLYHLKIIMLIFLSFLVDKLHPWMAGPMGSPEKQHLELLQISGWDWIRLPWFSLPQQSCYYCEYNESYIPQSSTHLLSNNSGSLCFDHKALECIRKTDSEFLNVPRASKIVAFSKRYKCPWLCKGVIFSQRRSLPVVFHSMCHLNVNHRTNHKQDILPYFLEFINRCD